MDEQSILAGGKEQLEEIKVALLALNDVRSTIEKHNADRIRLESDIDTGEQLMADTIEATIKKRREEVSASFDKEIDKDQGRLKKIKSDREKAKSKGIKERIEQETAEINEENRGLHNEIRTVFKQKGIKKLFDARFVYIMYFPKGIYEYLMFLLTAVITAFAIPFLVTYFFVDTHWFFETLIYIFIVAIFAGIYYLGYRYVRVKHKDTFRTLQIQRIKLNSNKARIKKIVKSIQKDTNEEQYNLSNYDVEILEVEDSINRVVSKKNEALMLFEKNTRPVISEEITNRDMVKINELKKQVSQISIAQKELEDKQKEMTINVTSKYEALIGKEFMTVEKILMLEDIIEDNKAKTISEAILVAKATI